MGLHTGPGRGQPKREIEMRKKYEGQRKVSCPHVVIDRGFARLDDNRGGEGVELH